MKYLIRYQHRTDCASNRIANYYSALNPPFGLAPFWAEKRALFFRLD